MTPVRYLCIPAICYTHIMYSPELVKKYTDKRDDYRENDVEILGTLESCGVKDRVVLDFGCGDGRNSQQILALGARKVVGIDISKEMIELALRRRQDNLEFIVADGSHIPSDDTVFDVIFSNFVIHYFEDASVPFAEIARVLKSSGYFVGAFNITDVEKGFERLYNTNMPIRLGKMEDNIIVRNRIKSRAEIEQSLHDCGLTLVSYKILHHPNAVVDDSFEYKDKVTKNAVLIVARKG